MTRRPWNTERMGPRTDVNVRHLQKAKHGLISHRYEIELTRIWANAHDDGRPAEYKHRRLCNATKVWLTPDTKFVEI